MRSNAYPEMEDDFPVPVIINESIDQERIKSTKKQN